MLSGHEDTAGLQNVTTAFAAVLLAAALVGALSAFDAARHVTAVNDAYDPFHVRRRNMANAPIGVGTDGADPERSWAVRAQDRHT